LERGACTFSRARRTVATGGLLQGPSGSSALCANPTPGGSNFDDTLKALAVALDQWADKGIEPPPSNYPGLKHGTLVRPDDFIANFPTIPGIGVPTGTKHVPDP